MGGQLTRGSVRYYSNARQPKGSASGHAGETCPPAKRQRTPECRCGHGLMHPLVGWSKPFNLVSPHPWFPRKYAWISRYSSRPRIPSSGRRFDNNNGNFHGRFLSGPIYFEREMSFWVPAISAASPNNIMSHSPSAGTRISCGFGRERAMHHLPPLTPMIIGVCSSS